MRISEYHNLYKKSFPLQKNGCNHSQNIHGKNKGIKRAWKQSRSR